MAKRVEVSAERLKVQMLGAFEKTMQQVMAALNAAPAGNMIGKSEHQVKHLMDELKRKTFEAAMQQAIAKGELVPNWTAKDCVLPVALTEKALTEKSLPLACDLVGEALSRIDLGCDGVLVPLITQAEKRLRRDKVLTRWRVLRTAGRKLAQLAQLPPLVPGADQPYKEFKLSVLYSQDHARRLVSITAGDHEVMGRIIKRDASRLKLKEVDEALGLFDGGPWIDAQMVRQQLRLTDKCLDFFHLKDNIQKTRREVFGDDEAGKAWAHDLAETFKTQGFTAGFDSLVTFRKTIRSPKKKQAATRLVNYVSDRRALITYPDFRAAGREIGSGPTVERSQQS